MTQSLAKSLSILLVLSWFSLPIAATAEDLTDGDRQAFQEIITKQIDAFRIDNADAAFAYAAPRIQNLFRDPQVFIAMVRKSYLPVYRPQFFEFGEAALKHGQPTQIVKILGPNGNPWAALYTFERQADGSWRISGVFLLKQEGAAA